MSLEKRLRWIFLANATVLITHQIDAAYWHEWELFRIPGGNQVNLILNIPIIALVLYAHYRVISNVKTGLQFHTLLSILGFLTIIIHSFFFLVGSDAFVQPMSIGLLIATSILSSWQFIDSRTLKNLDDR
jgi:hypothetical protein